jgi:hypothetical protein
MAFRRSAHKLNESMIFTVCNSDEDKIICDEIGEYIGGTVLPP